MNEYLLPASRLGELFAVLQEEGYEVIGPALREGAVVLTRLNGVDDLPRGLRDRQAPGSYRLEQAAGAAEQAYFGVTLPPQAWKQYLSPPTVRLWRAVREGGAMRLLAEPATAPRRAFLGVRACDLAALAILDRIYLQGAYPDPIYQAHREATLVVAVNCTMPAATCFCASMGTGPSASAGFDLALTEILDRQRHAFLVKVGSKPGQGIVEQLELAAAHAEELALAQAAVADAAERMGRSLDTTGLPELLAAGREAEQWQRVGERCLSCGNCTMVCPTCFCSTVEDRTELDGARAERVRRWDSCFTAEFSALHNGSVRSSVAARYRQWLTHKLGTWVEQFGTFGCVGCGRCISWCPVGIDITAEAAAIRAELSGRADSGLLPGPSAPPSSLPERGIP